MFNNTEVLELLKNIDKKLNRLESEVRELRKEVNKHDQKQKIRTDKIISYCSDFAYDETDEHNI